MHYKNTILFAICQSPELLLRAVAKSLIAAFDGREMGRSEDTSRSGKGLSPSALP